MPLYDYKCTACGRTTEVRHGFDHKHTDPCPHCGGALARVFNPAPIVFKGSGFYINDSKSSSSASSASSSASSGSETKSDGASTSTSDAKTDAPVTPPAPAKTESTSDSAA